MDFATAGVSDENFEIFSAQFGPDLEQPVGKVIRDRASFRIVGKQASALIPDGSAIDQMKMIAGHPG